MMSNQAGLGIGDKVHTQEINEYPPDVQEAYLRLSEWVRQTYATYGRRVWIKVIDPQSMVGLWKHVRYGIRAYPTFILDGEYRYVGWEAVTQTLQHVDRLLETRQLVGAG